MNGVRIYTDLFDSGAINNQVDSIKAEIV